MAHKGLPFIPEDIIPWIYFSITFVMLLLGLVSRGLRRFLGIAAATSANDRSPTARARFVEELVAET